jgi:hypothetical protein
MGTLPPLRTDAVQPSQSAAPTDHIHPPRHIDAAGRATLSHNMGTTTCLLSRDITPLSARRLSTQWKPIEPPISLCAASSTLLTTCLTVGSSPSAIRAGIIAVDAYLASTTWGDWALLLTNSLILVGITLTTAVNTLLRVRIYYFATSVSSIAMLGRWVGHRAGFFV